jgi:phosphoglucosamine mutase
MATFFGSSGIRREVDTDLFKLALEVGMAVGAANRTAVVGCDHRTSSDSLKHAVISGLLATGCQAFDAGIAPTPVIAYAARRFDTGIMITASHNPPEYNGIKLFNADGSSYDSAQRQQIEKKLTDKSICVSQWSEMKKAAIYPDAVDEHLLRAMKDFTGKLNLRVVTDCRCGAASEVTPRLLEQLGCEVVRINCSHDGLFQCIEPTPQNLKGLSEAVVHHKADLGIANDGDGDRMVVVDDTGGVVSGDQLMAVFARELKITRLVTPVDTSMALEEMGFKVTRTRVGDSFVSEELKAGGDFGGEQSGCWIFPAMSYCPDGVYASAKIVGIASKNRLSEIVHSIPSYPMLRGGVSAKGVTVGKLKGQLQKIECKAVSTIDGIHLTFADAWLLVRPSGTEPIIRIAAEAKSQDRAKEVYNMAIKAIENCRAN